MAILKQHWDLCRVKEFGIARDILLGAATVDLERNEAVVDRCLHIPLVALNSRAAFVSAVTIV
jgi:hypothetical protein